MALNSYLTRVHCIQILKDNRVSGNTVFDRIGDSVSTLPPPKSVLQCIIHFSIVYPDGLVPYTCTHSEDEVTEIWWHSHVYCIFDYLIHLSMHVMVECGVGLQCTLHKALQSYSRPLLLSVLRRISLALQRTRGQARFICATTSSGHVCAPGGSCNADVFRIYSSWATLPNWAFTDKVEKEQEQGFDE